MIKEKYDKLPDFIREKYMQEIEVSQPMKILEHIVFIGKKFGASDVHITGVPYDEVSGDNLVNIKYRIDGKLDNYIYNLNDEIRNDPKSYITMDKFDQVMRGIKTAIEMEYNETEIPQDAAYKFEHIDSSGVKIDETKVRVNSMPIGVDIIKKGEVGVHQSLVMRIINDSVDALPKYEQLGIMPTDMIRLNKFLDSQKGALIISGPTGSGKSVFLQVIMNVIASDDKKIHTLEDPIEYRNPLLIQTQIKTDKGFTWQEGIRALMRQDPDIIMVGEVRDEESAELFIEASLTGHMGFATTHAKTGCGAFDRLKLMGVKPYIIVGGISISASERLSQKLCPNCRVKVEDEVTKEKLENIWEDKFGTFDFTTLTAKDICMMIGDDEYSQLSVFENLYRQFKSLKNKLRKACDDEKVEIKRFIESEHNKLVKGLKIHFINSLYNRLEAKEGEIVCNRCGGKGVKGRIGAFEFIETTKEIEQQVLEDVPLKHMEAYVRENNILTLDRYGIVRAMRGEIDMQELLKLL